MKSTKKITALFLAALLLLSGVTAASAEETNTLKEEVIYVNLNEAGEVEDITPVNSFELENGGLITDYGNYTSLRNMTANDKISYSGDKVTVNTKSGKLYYEGRLKEKNMPWNIAVKYYLNDEEITAKKLAGKSGRLKININVTKNSECGGNFYEGYALQAAVTLDTERCKNIVAENATIANVGSDKQLSYIILPGNGAHITVTADVTDFIMDGISFNGVKLNLSLSADSTELDGKIGELTDGVSDIDSASAELKNGLNSLKNGTGTLKSSAAQLKNGAENALGGADKLSGGLTAASSKNAELLAGAYKTYCELCTAASNEINGYLAGTGLTVSLTSENYSRELSAIIAAYPSAADALNKLKTELDEYGRFYNGLKEYTAAVSSAANGAAELKNGLSDLSGGTAALNSGAGELDSAAQRLYDGAGKLNGGTSELLNKTKGAAENFNSEISSAVNKATGGDISTGSFVSDKNLNVKSVQFVIKTSAVKKAEAEKTAAKAEEKLNFWQKLLKLFGL